MPVVAFLTRNGIVANAADEGWKPGKEQVDESKKAIVAV